MAQHCSDWPNSTVSEHKIKNLTRDYIYNIALPLLSYCIHNTLCIVFPIKQLYQYWHVFINVSESASSECLAIIEKHMISSDSSKESLSCPKTPSTRADICLFIVYLVGWPLCGGGAKGYLAGHIIGGGLMTGLDLHHSPLERRICPQQKYTV